jgi:hypothetical protein
MFNLYALDSSENKSRYSHWLFGHPSVSEEKTQRLPFSLSDFQRRLDSRPLRSPTRTVATKLCNPLSHPPQPRSQRKI